MKNKRAKNWTDEETSLFIEIWSEHYEKLRSSGTRNIPVYNAMAQQLKEISASSRSMTATEVKTKVTNLVAEYRKKKEVVGKSGGSPSAWRFFDRIDQIIGKAEFFISEALH